MGPSRTKALGRRKRTRLPAKVQRVSVKGLRAARKPIAGHRRRRGRRPSWKLVGLAGIAGVAATGAVVARNRRTHRELPPDELRAALHDRLAAVAAEPPPASA